MDAACNICNFRFETPEEISVILYNWSNYDYHFIIKELAQQFKEQFKWLGENMEKW